MPKRVKAGKVNNKYFINKKGKGKNSTYSVDVSGGDTVYSEVENGQIVTDGRLPKYIVRKLESLYRQDGHNLWHGLDGDAIGSFKEGGNINSTPKKMSYKIFEGSEPRNGTPLYQVIGVDNEYVGGWHTDKSKAEKELSQLQGGSTYAGGGEIEVGDKFYSYENPDTLYGVTYISGEGEDKRYKLSLRDKDGYSYSSKNISRNSLSKTSRKSDAQKVNTNKMTKEQFKEKWGSTMYLDQYSKGGSTYADGGSVKGQHELVGIISGLDSKSKTFQIKQPFADGGHKVFNIDYSKADNTHNQLENSTTVKIQGNIKGDKMTALSIIRLNEKGGSTYAGGGTVIKKGNRVRVVNTQFDGQEGLVMSNDLVDGKYTVQMSDGSMKGFPFENLMLLSRETYSEGGEITEKEAFDKWVSFNEKQSAKIERLRNSLEDPNASLGNAMTSGSDAAKLKEIERLESDWDKNKAFYERAIGKKLSQGGSTYQGGGETEHEYFSKLVVVPMDDSRSFEAKLEKAGVKWDDYGSTDRYDYKHYDFTESLFNKHKSLIDEYAVEIEEYREGGELKQTTQEKVILEKHGFSKFYSGIYGDDTVDNAFIGTQGQKGVYRGDLEFGLAYVYEDEHSGVLVIDKDLMDWLADAFSGFPLTVYTNAGVDLHSSKKGKYKNITFKRIDTKDIYKKGGAVNGGYFTGALSFLNW